MRVRGWALLLVRAVWAVVATVALGLFVVGLPARAEDLNRRFVDLVGLEAEANQAGDIVLSPRWNSAASRAGILEGDVLVAIDGTPLQAGAGRAAVEALPHGALGEQVQFSV